MPEMRTIVTDNPVAWCVCQSASLFCKMAAQIEVQFEEISESSRNIALDGGSNFAHVFDAAFSKLLWPLVLSTGLTVTGPESMSFSATLQQNWQAIFVIIYMYSKIKTGAYKRVRRAKT